MDHLDSMLQAARARLSDLPAVEPAGEAKGGALLGALRGRQHLSVIAGYSRRHPLSPPRSRERPLLSSLEAFGRAGVAAASLVTEHSLHAGRLLDLELAAGESELPLIATDVVVDPRFVRVAAGLGASGVELVARAVTPGLLEELVVATEEAGCLPIVQCWSREDVERALALSACVVRLTDIDLRTFERDAARLPALLDLVPADRVCVAPLDLENPRGLANLRGRADALLVGMALLKSDDPAALIQELSS